MSVKHLITIFIGNREPEIYDLDAFGKNQVRLGRGACHGEDGSPVNDIVIDADISFVSRAHCTFQKMEDGWYILDDRSINGLVFNDTKIISQQLHDGDKFYIGKSTNERCVIAFSQSRKEEEDEVKKVSLAERNRYVLGRDRDCDIIINHPSVSRHHCIISCENSVYYIMDNNSMNGVILNGSPLHKKQRLEQMDKIVIADTYMVFSNQLLYFVKNTGGVSVAAYNLCKAVRTKQGAKYITSNVSISIEPGEFVAIIGGSGAGKTTLLNCLSGMTEFTSGDVLINGESIKTNSNSIQSLIGYVPQNDIVYDNLTLERMLFYSAKLRMPKDTTKEEIRQKIDETIHMVELDGQRNTLISKLSGGQKKRASIAVELLASPKLFFLDEPSSGLDPGTEKNLMEMLKKLAISGKTVIMVTHTVQNIHFCDRVICMGKGGLLCYSGSPEKALNFFEKDNMTDIYEELNENSYQMSEKFNSKRPAMNRTAKSEDKVKEKKKPDIANGFRQFFVMTKRYAEIIWNNRSRLILLLLMPVLLTILVCIAFQADGNLYNYLGITIDRTNFPFLVGSDTMSLMFAFACAGFWVGIFDAVQEISKERTIYEREQFTGVTPVPYVMSKLAINSVLCIIQAAVMVLLFVWLTNTTATINGDMTASTAMELGMSGNGVVLTNGLGVEIYITTLITLLSAMCLGLTISASASNDMALVICPVFLLPQILFSGVACTLTGITETISKIITCRWSCIAYFTSTAVNEMYESCSYDTGTWNKVEFTNGFGVDEAYSTYKTYLFGLNPVWSAWIALLILSIVCIALAVLALHIKKNGIRIKFKRYR